MNDVIVSGIRIVMSGGLPDPPTPQVGGAGPEESGNKGISSLLAKFFLRRSESRELERVVVAPQ